MATKTTKTTRGFTVACMNCHGGKCMTVDMMEQAQREADIHLLGGGNKDHTGHVVVITKVKLVRVVKS